MRDDRAKVRRRPLAPAIRASIGLHAAVPAALLAWPHAWPWAVGAIVLDHAGLTAAGMWPRSTLLGPNLRRLPQDAAARREMALTFDDGPDPEVTPRILDLLDRHAARASFFCIASAARAHPAVLRDIVRRGHSVENHTATHPYHFACLAPAGLRWQIGDAQAALADLAGVAPGFFRAPMGLRSPLLDPVLAETGLRLAAWTRRARDGVAGDPARALRRLAGGLAAGDILLLHDGRCARAPSGNAVALEVLPGLLQAIAAAGLTAVPLPQACGGAGMAL